MASAGDVKKFLFEHTEVLVTILEQVGFSNIKKNDSEIRCSHEKNSNPNGVHIYLSEKLISKIYTKDLDGDIYDLIIFKTKRSFKEVHNVLTKYCGLSSNIKNKRKLFGGVFENNCTIKEESIYEDEILTKYEDITSYRFFEDGIDASTQRFFGVRYDNISNRIIIPWRNELGELVGTVGRYNYEIKNEEISKYTTLEKFQKTNYLFGIHIEKIRKAILKKNEVIVVEAEKSVMKAFQMSVYNVVAIGSHSISEKQLKTLRYLCKNIVIAFDEDVEEHTLLKISSRLFDEDFTVSYIYDAKRTYLKRFSKKSPMDLPFDEFEKMYSKKIIFNG